ncbi:MAG: primosomal protein N' [Actinobacteria bacterium]|uniref:DNA 3'-5' helicase n=1 Tax=freshwater metagenome TaxID=449393 RepID=A0A6J7D5D1_9ZZZZ|nr:primosomal protein N' [Actinomycetota bacterium]
MRIARVEPLTAARALRGPFDYLLPDGFPDVVVGTRLSVPFAGRKLEAVVTEVTGQSELPESRLAKPTKIVEPSIPEDLVAMALWMAGAYCSTPARALALVSPPGASSGVRARETLVAEITGAGSAALGGDGRLTEGQRLGLAELEAGPLRASDSSLGHQGLRRLEKRGLVVVRSDQLSRRPAPSTMDAGLVSPALNGEQLAALDPILEALDSVGTPAGFLLHGITGSGKTEVYIHAAERALEQGRGVIVLVPEIALTPQAVARFTARLGDTVAVLHSGLSMGERFDEWSRLRSGEARVCVGPRSAVFAPIDKLGLVIVDEEHESSYRNDGDPGYDARELASWRSEHWGAVLVAGSATPRPESVRRLARLRLDHRADGAQLPPVELLDMKGVKGVLHPKAVEALGVVRAERTKAIVLLNRRGWSNFLACQDCGRVWKCPQCDVSLVLHRSENRITCHHCGHSEAFPTKCSDCGSTSISRHGAGTERIEDELRRILGDESFPIFRLDADAASGKGEAERILGEFQRAPAGVLVGTQMVAKGHDFPDVTLGLVLDADSTLRFPDFRSEERTFQLVTQLAGRAGRGAKGGTVLVQTTSPEVDVLQLAAKHDSDGFLELELERRDGLGYPPAVALVRVFCGSADVDALDRIADGLVEHIEATGIEVLGPAPLFRLKGRERRQLVARSPDRERLVAAVDSAISAHAADASKSAVVIGTEVDAG